MNKKEKDIQNALGTRAAYTVSAFARVPITVMVALPFTTTVKAIDDEDAEKNAIAFLNELTPEQRKDLILDSLDEMDVRDIINEDDFIKAARKTTPADKFRPRKSDIYDTDRRDDL